MIVNAILKRRPDLHVTMTDIAPRIGTFLDPDLSGRVALHPGTAARAMIGTGRAFDAITVTDVLHHVPADARPAFWRDLAEICRDTGCRLLIVKDVRPGTIRGRLSLWSDWYVTGDRHVTLMTPDAMASDIREAFQGGIEALSHAEPDRANYCWVVRLR